MNVKSAYINDAAYQYDEQRFRTPQGQLFHDLEQGMLTSCLRDFPQPGTVVEVGCGTGRFLASFQGVAETIIGIDPSEDMLHVAEKKRADHNLSYELRQGEGASIPVDNASADFVYSIRTLNQVGTKEYAVSMIHELFRICKPGGHVLIEFVNRNSLNNGKKDVRFSTKELQEIIDQEGLGTLLWTRGILCLTNALLMKCPRFLIPFFRFTDRITCRLLPKNCTRTYMLFAASSEKASPAVN